MYYAFFIVSRSQTNLRAKQLARKSVRDKYYTLCGVL